MSDETTRAVEEYRARAALRQSAGELGINPVAVFEDVMFYADMARKTVAAGLLAGVCTESGIAAIEIRFSDTGEDGDCQVTALDGAGTPLPPEELPAEELNYLATKADLPAFVAGEPWAPAWWQNKPAEVDRFSLDGAGATGKVVLRVNPDGDTRWFDAFVARLPEVGYDMLRVAVDRARAEGATAAGNRNV